METQSVEANLQIDPPLPGKFSWAGRRMAYTLLAPASYGSTYHVQLRFAQDKLAGQESDRQIQPFEGIFRTRDRALVYLGVAGEEQGRLILYNFTQQRKTILTPTNLVVVDFEPYPDGEKILFSATERTSDSQELVSAQLYTVTTGIDSGTKDNSNNFLPIPTTNKPVPTGKIDLILDNKNYQNLKFDLSPDGKTIVVQRVSRQHPDQFGFGLFVLTPNPNSWILNQAATLLSLQTVLL